MHSHSHTPTHKPFPKKPFTEFWFETRTEFSTIADIALNILLQFNIKYLCELTLSTLTHIKFQYLTPIKI